VSDPTIVEKPELTNSPVTALVLGLLAGAGSAFLGIGGGLLMVPGMVFLLRIQQRRAVGTSLAVILPTAIVGALGYHAEAVARGLPGLDIWVVVWLAVGGVVGARWGATLANRLKAKQLRSVFGIFVMLTAAYMIMRALMFQVKPVAPPEMDLVHAVQLVATGVLVGVVSGLLGVGGGLVMVPALALIMGLSQHQAQAISLAVIIPVSISAGLIHLASGNIIGTLALPMSVGAVLAAWVTTSKVFLVSDGRLKLIFGIFLLVIGASMVYSPKRKAASADPPVTPEPPLTKA
jgi:uncharacterized membrane protein YfcA